jgi:hypothetical protein
MRSFEFDVQGKSMCDTTDFKETEWRSKVRSPRIIGAFAVASVGYSYDNETS